METEVDFFLVFMIITIIILAVSINLEHTSCCLHGFSVACNQKVWKALKSTHSACDVMVTTKGKNTTRASHLPIFQQLWKLQIVALNWKSWTFQVGNLTLNISAESNPNKGKVFSWQHGLKKTMIPNLTMWTLKIKVAARGHKLGWSGFQGHPANQPAFSCQCPSVCGANTLPSDTCQIHTPPSHRAVQTG